MGKKLLVVAATAKEISPFIQLLRKEHFTKNKIDLLISGIGLTTSTYHLIKQLNYKKYDCVIQAGVAGCFDLSVPLGSVLVVKQDTIADQSVVELEKLKTLFDLKLVPANSYPFTKGWLLNPNKDILKRSGLKSVKAISVNQITTSTNMIKYYNQTFHPVLESMEGAALHYVCLMEKIPFLQLRSISNYIGERNKKNWNMMDSIVNLNQGLVQIVNNF